MRKANIIVLVAVIIAVSFIMTAKILSNTAVSIKNKGNVSVKGFAKQQIKSDHAVLKAAIISENMDLKACYAQLSQDKNKVVSFLKAKYNVTDKEFNLSPAQIKEVYKVNDRGYNTDEFIKYVLRQDFKVESNDVEKIEKISCGFIDVLEQGVKIEIGVPEYMYSKLDDLKVEMIGRATSNARERALRIAKEGKFSLGQISSVRVGIFQITPIHSTDVADYGINDTSSIEKEIKSVVEIEYFVK